MRKLLAGVAIATLISACSHEQQAAERTNIYASGSSTVFPFTKAVADQFHASHPDLQAVQVEEIGTGPGIAKFCGGTGSEFPDIANASRRMKPEEIADCKAHGVTGIAELQIGMDGIAFIQAPGAPKISLTAKQIYEALAAEPYGEPQKARKWKDIDPSLPDIPILVYGPPVGDGTRDSVNELILNPVCQKDRRVAAMTDQDRVKQVCALLRGDGAYHNAGENDEKTTISMIVNPGAIGILGYSYLEQNAAKLRAVPINRQVPTAETVRSGKYVGSRPLFIYIKRGAVEHIAGMKDFITAYVAAIAPNGDLAKRGLIPATDEIRAATSKIAASLPASPTAAPAKS